MEDVGAFKAVMFCAPPARVASGPTTSQGGGGGANPPFKSRVAYTNAYGVSTRPRHDFREVVRQIQAEKARNSVLTKHKRWLSDLASLKAQIEQTQANEVANMQERRDQFDAMCARRRARIRGGTQAGRGPKFLEDEREEQEWIDKRVQAWDERRQEQDPPGPAKEQGIYPRPPKEKKGKAARKIKPKWAMTEQECDMDEDLEADELLNFADGLDFDKYVDDLESVSEVEGAKARERAGQQRREMEEAEELENNDDSGDDEGATRSCGVLDNVEGAPPKKPKHLKPLTSKSVAKHDQDQGEETARRPEWDASTAVSVASGASGDPRLAALKANHRTIRQVHSSASLRTILGTMAAEAEPASGATVKPMSLVRHLPAIARAVDDRVPL